MSNHQILNPRDHADLRINTQFAPELGDGVMASIALPAEFRALACDFPIIFHRDIESGGVNAVTLFGFEEGENLFLAGGRWNARTRPLAMRVQPFLIGRPASEDAEPQVHVDLDSPRISTDGEGVLCFDEDGMPTPYVEEVAGLLGDLHQAHMDSEAFYAAVERYQLLEPFSLDVTLGNGARHRMVGYEIVNEDKLVGLEPGALAELHAGGHLQPLYMAMASLGNLGKLIDLKNHKMHG